MAGKYEKYKPEFRDEVARLVVETTRSIADVSREYGLNETTVGGWVKKYRATHAADEPPLELSERARLRELVRRNRELEMENAFLKKGLYCHECGWPAVWYGSSSVTGPQARRMSARAASALWKP